MLVFVGFFVLLTPFSVYGVNSATIIQRHVEQQLLIDDSRLTDVPTWWCSWCILPSSVIHRIASDVEHDSAMTHCIRLLWRHRRRVASNRRRGATPDAHSQSLTRTTNQLTNQVALDFHGGLSKQTWLAVDGKNEDAENPGTKVDTGPILGGPINSKPLLNYH